MLGRTLGQIGVIVAALAFSPPVADAADAQKSHALVVGIDAYRDTPPLRGAVADARDLARSLRQIGVRDIEVLLDSDATRAHVLASLDALAKSIRPGDTIFLTIAGYGAKDAAGGDMVLLSSFDPAHPDTESNRILISELTDSLKRIEAAGGRAFFVSDTGFGDNVPRDIDPRTNPPTYRTLELPHVSQGNGPRASVGLHRTFWVGAVDDRDRAPEVNVPGIGYRGALSYAFSRAIEGGAEASGDGTLATSDLLSYMRQVVHQLSDQRQIVALNADSALRLDVGASGSARGISVRPVGAQASTSSGFTIAPADGPTEAKNDYDFGAAVSNVSVPAAPSIAPSSTVSLERPAANASSPSAPGGGAIAPSSGAPIKLASLDGGTSYFKGLQGQEPVVFVAPNASPDLTWDPRTHDVLAGSDVIANNVDSADLAGVVERSLALSMLKQKGTIASQPITLLPSDSRHTKGTRIEIEVGQLTNRYLVLFNLSGNGNVQLLYPLGSDPPQRPDATYSVEFQVREPFGADHVIAVTSTQRMGALETFLKQAGRHLKSDRLAEELSRRETQNVRVGFIGLFTTP